MRRAYIASLPILLLLAARGALASEAFGVPDEPQGATTPGAGQSEALTLEQAIERGLATSHRLGELRAREAGAQAAARGARAAARPQVGALAGYTRTNHVDEFGIALPGQPLRVIYPDIPDNVRTRLDLQWPIYTFGRTDAMERAAAAESEATGLDLAAARNDLKLEITRAFWAVVTAGESVNVLAESLKRMEATLEDVRNRLKVGLIPPNDVLSVEAQRSRQEVLLVQARNLREQSLADLRRLIGAPADAPLQLQAQLDPPANASPAVAQLVEQARKSRPERQAIEVRIAGAGQRREAALAGRRPVISVGGGVDYARPNPRIFPRTTDWRTSWDASVNFNWTFWDGGRVAADVAQQAAMQQAARERLAEFDSQLELEVLQRRLDVDATQAAISAARDAVRAATEARRVVGDRFAAGVATSTEVLDAQVALLQAQLDLAQSLATARLAQARLARAIGQ
jgi:outer membrane protein TolC